MRISTDGVVLRDYKLEDDRILTILTRTHGVITAYAGGAARPRSALVGSTELLCHSDFVLFKNKDRYTVDKADSRRIFFGLRSRYEDLSLASYLAQLFSELSPHEEAAEDQLNLLLACLHYLETQKRPPGQIKAVAELRLLTLSGYMPNLVGCKVTGVYTPEGDSMHFSPQGDLYCGMALEGQHIPGLMPVAPGVLQAMRHIVYSDSARLFRFTLSEKGMTSLTELCEKYLLYQIEKTLPTLEFYRSIIRGVESIQ